MHAVRTQCKVWYVGKYSCPSFGPFPQVFPYQGFLVFLCIGDGAYFNCHPFLPICNQFYPFSIPFFSPPWGPREGRGDVAILIYPHHLLGMIFNKGIGVSLISCPRFGFVLLSKSYSTYGLSYIKGVVPKLRGQQLSNVPVVYNVDVWLTWVSVPIPYRPSLFKHRKFVQTYLKAVSLLSCGLCCCAVLLSNR